MDRKSALIITILSLTLAASNASFASEEVHSVTHEQAPQPLINKKSPYHNTAQKYVEWQVIKRISGELEVSLNSELGILATNDSVESQYEINRWLTITNNSRANLATDLGLEVSKLSNFLDYFYNNKNYYYFDDENPYSSFFLNRKNSKGLVLSAIERIKVVCVGSYCNSPSTFSLKWDIWSEAYSSGAIYADVFQAEVVDPNNQPYPNSNGTEWVYLGINGIEPTSNCERCSIE